MGLGARIRKKRKEVGLNLNELAEKTSLTSGFISQVERDLTEPSITSLRKISEVLGVAIFYFLMEETNEHPVVRKDERKKLKLSKEHIEYELLSPNLNGQMEMFIGKLDSGAVTCEKPLSHPGEEVIYVIKGTMLIEVGEDKYTVYEEDSIYYFSSVPHKITNIGDDQLVFLSTITPPQF